MEFIPIHSPFAQSLYQWLLPTLCNVLVSMDPIKRSVVHQILTHYATASKPAPFTVK